jgi:hypothetical protein
MTKTVTSHRAGTDAKHRVIGRKTSEKLADDRRGVKHREKEGGKTAGWADFSRV